MKQRFVVTPHSPSAIDLILSCIKSSGYRTVHYTGAADEALLRALLTDPSELEISVMDMPDRWGTGFAFFYDEREFPDNPPCDRPDWLDGIPFYQEGAPDHEIVIYDWPWTASDRIDRMVRLAGRKAPSMLIILGLAHLCEVAYFGELENGEFGRGSMLREAPFRHPSYAWEHHEGVWIGKWIPGQDPLQALPEVDYDDE